jgi:hypothetical protein
MTRLELGELYFTQGGVLGRRFLGGVVWMAQQIKQGGYADPTAEQIAWADAVIAAANMEPFANAALKWGCVNNVTLQQSGSDIDDAAVDFIVAESARTYVAA